MRLLFDHHLSPRLVTRLADLFPASAHVADYGLDRATDAEVWDFARLNDFTLVTKDADFNDLTALRGFPPKVVWLRIGNCSTNQVEALLRTRDQDLLDFVADPQAAIIEFWRP
jgi:predicted nuclease of predicted toxin-antitoxin system